MILPFTIEAPKLLYLVTRLIFGSIGACTTHVIRGFDVYDDLTAEEISEGKDYPSLFYFRMGLLWFLCGFTIYLLTSCLCLVCIAGLGGDDYRSGQGRRFKRIPFGNLLFNEELDCAICLNRFRENTRVVQLTCHEKHIFHRTCLQGWIESNHHNCPLCRQEINFNN